MKEGARTLTRATRVESGQADGTSSCLCMHVSWVRSAHTKTWSIRLSCAQTRAECKPKTQCTPAFRGCTVPVGSQTKKRTQDKTTRKLGSAGRARQGKAASPPAVFAGEGGDSVLRSNIQYNTVSVPVPFVMLNGKGRWSSCTLKTGAAQLGQLRRTVLPRAVAQANASLTRTLTPPEEDARMTVKKIEMENFANKGSGLTVQNFDATRDDT